MKKYSILAALLGLVGSLQAAAFDGFYSGINFGWAHPGLKLTTSAPNGTTAQKTFHNNALTIGVQAGYAMAMANKFYLGSELNFNYDGFGRKKSSWDLTSIGWGNTRVVTKKIWHIALAGKAGYSFGSIVPYLGGFGGLAGHEAKIYYTAATNGKARRTGIIYGPLLGADYKVTERLIAGLEGRMDFGSTKKRTIGSNKFKVQPRGFDVRARVNFAF